MLKGYNSNRSMTNPDKIDFFNKKMSMQGYDPNKSQLNPYRIEEFLQAPICGDLLEVPGISPAAVKALKDAGISSTYQLMGRFFSIKSAGVQSVELCDSFYYFLTDIGIRNNSRNSIVKSIAMKADVFFPGIYDETAYE